MHYEGNRYEILKSAYDFLNRQISLFEKNIDINNAEYDLLEEIGVYTKASKVQLTRYYKGLYSLVKQWRNDSDNHEEQRIVSKKDITNFAEWTALLMRKLPVYVKDIESMDEELRASYYELKDNNIKSIYVLPLSDNNELIGIITICNPDEYIIKGIDEIHEILGNWLAYRMAKNNTRLQRALSGLGIDYTAAYVLNLDTGRYEVIVNQITNNVKKVEICEYFRDYVANYADIYVLDEYRASMKKMLSTDYIKEQFKTKDDYHYSFEAIPNMIDQTCFQAHIIKIYGEDGRYAVIGFRCVDEIVKKERALKDELNEAYRKQKKQLDMITAAIPGGIKISNDDETYSFKYVSEQYANMLGYDSPDELIEASKGSVAGIAHPDDLHNGIAEALEQYSRGDHYEITYRMKCKDGSWKYIEDHGHKVINEDGTIEHWNLILDKNGLVQKTIELESEKKANEAKSAFLSRMSHDIRTPLNGIMGLIAINDKHSGDRKLVDANRKKAKVAAQHLLSLINDILELSKLKDTDIDLPQEVVDVKKLMEDVRTITGLRAKAQGVTIHINNNMMEPVFPYIIGSALHIEQIFINIIANAIKYNKPCGSIYCTLNETLLTDKTIRYNVRIQDTGIGMSEEFVDRIFQPFVQADNGSRSEYMGTGLGMPIVKNLIDRMGGDIRITSKLGEGTTVDVILTFTIADKKDIPKENTEDIKDINLKGVRVLLAEDNDLNREIVQTILHDKGVNVTEAVDGQQALSIFENSPEDTFDLILMDVMMPNMDGIQATKAIRKSGKKDSDIPIFAMTANEFASDRQMTKEAGMNEHLSKPLDTKELFVQIKNYCCS